MEKNNKKLSIEEAYNFLENAPRENKEMWIKHSVNVAIVAERLAEELNLDSKKAYVLGLVHDIGRREKEHIGLRHIIEGYNFLVNLGYEEEARGCITHSFYTRDLVKSILKKENTNLTRTENNFIIDYINKNGFNTYDKILQIADNIGSTTGINTIERRRTESMLRYGVTDITEKNLRGIFKIQNEIEDKLGHSIYLAFPEVTDNINKTLVKDFIANLK